MKASSTDHFQTSEPLSDAFGRRFGYLRLSLTEACNMACTYCLPHGFPEWYRHKARLGINELHVILKGFRLLDFKKVRFTGGEPTVHPHCRNAISLAQDLGYEEIAMTTNGLNIGELNSWLAKGLTQLNVSLDSLNPHIFKEMTGSSELDRVMDLLDEAMALGLKLKINTVLVRSKNGSEEHIEDLIRWALDRPLTLRFIELMDTGLNKSFAGKERVLSHEVMMILNRMYPGAPKKNIPQNPLLAGPATEVAIYGRPGKIGFISPLSCNFCASCNRLRITAKGRLKLCLFGDQDHELSLTTPEELAQDVRKLIQIKPERHQLNSGHMGNVETFRTIGG